MDTYLEELEGIDKAGSGEKEAVTLSAMAGDKQAQARLAELFLPEVVEIAKLYSGQGGLPGRFNRGRQCGRRGGCYDAGLSGASERG